MSTQKPDPKFTQFMRAVQRPVAAPADAEPDMFDEIFRKALPHYLSTLDILQNVMPHLRVPRIFAEPAAAALASIELNFESGDELLKLVKARLFYAKEQYRPDLFKAETVTARKSAIAAHDEINKYLSGLDEIHAVFDSDEASISKIGLVVSAFILATKLDEIMSKPDYDPRDLFKTVYMCGLNNAVIFAKWLHVCGVPLFD